MGGSRVKYRGREYREVVKEVDVVVDVVVVGGSQEK